MLVIAGNALREVRHRRLVWLVLGVGVLIAAASFMPYAFYRLAANAGETKLAERAALQLVSGVTGAMGGLALMLSLFLGATAISAEVRSKTIVTVLARPLERWQLVLGRWLGFQAFVFLVLLVGWATALGLGWWLGAVPGRGFWLSETETLVRALFYGAVSLGLATFLPPALAGFSTLALEIIPEMAQHFIGAEQPVVRAAAWSGYLIGSAVMPDGVIGSATQDVMNPRYGMFAAVLAEHLLYAATMLLVGCWVFSRREIRLG